MTRDTPPRPPSVGSGRTHRLVAESGYLLTALPLALASFAVLSAGVLAGVGLLVTLVGAPLLLATLSAGRAFGRVEQRRMASLAWGSAGNTEEPRVDPQGQGRLARVRDGRSWRTVAHGVLALPAAMVTASVALLWWALAVFGTTWPLYGFVLDRVNDPAGRDLPELLGVTGYAARSAVWCSVGLLAAVTLPAVVRGLARIQSSLGRLLLTA